MLRPQEAKGRADRGILENERHGLVVTALTLLGQVSGQNVRVDMTGGTLFIDVVRREDGGVSDLFLTGPTNVVCKGCITDENL